MKRWMWALLLLFPAWACGSLTGPPYDNNDLELLTGYRAKELCTCLFVMEMDEAYCAEWTVAAPNLATYQVDRVRKAVATEALFMWGARAHLDGGGDDGKQFGCVIDR